jgi:hypothetical protein
VSKLYYLLRAHFDRFIDERFIYNAEPPPAAVPPQEISYNLNRVVLSRIYDPKSNTVSVTYTDEDRTVECEETADLFVVAGGAGSSLRAELTDSFEISRTYVGYVAYRGLVDEKDLPDESRRVLAENATVSPFPWFRSCRIFVLKIASTVVFQFFYVKGAHFIAYFIPGDKGTVEAGERQMNWVSARL